MKLETFGKAIGIVIGLLIALGMVWLIVLGLIAATKAVL